MALVRCAGRPSTPADVPAITELLAQAGLHPNMEPQDLHWKYWQPRADWPGPRSFVLTDGSTILAHGGIIPGSYVWESHRLSTVHVIDWAASPREIGAGVALMNYLGQQAEALLAIGGSAQTLQILPRIGFRAAGMVTGYVRALSARRLLRYARPRNWRLVPRVARSVAWRLAAPAAAPGDGWVARRIAGDDLERISVVFPVPARGTGTFARSAELFSYTLACPIVPMRLYSVERAGRVRGYFMLAAAPGQVRIVDCWMDSDRPADWRAMVHCAIEEAGHDPQAAEVVVWASDPLLAECLRASGFHARLETAILLRSTNGAAVPATPVRAQMLDNDAAYLHVSRSELWM
jgi:hypothetical protein